MSRMNCRPKFPPTEKVKCPHCEHGFSDVDDSRPDMAGRGYRRRRICRGCHRRYFTLEQPDTRQHKMMRKPRTRPKMSGSHSTS